MARKLKRPAKLSAEDRSSRVNGPRQTRQASKLAAEQGVADKEELLHKRATRGQKTEDVYELAEDEAINPQDKPVTPTRTRSQKNDRKKAVQTPPPSARNNPRKGPSKAKEPAANDQPVNEEEQETRVSPRLRRKRQAEEDHTADQTPKKARKEVPKSSRNIGQVEQRAQKKAASQKERNAESRRTEQPVADKLPRAEEVEASAEDRPEKELQAGNDQEIEGDGQEAARYGELRDEDLQEEIMRNEESDIVDQDYQEEANENKQPEIEPPASGEDYSRFFDKFRDIDMIRRLVNWMSNFTPRTEDQERIKRRALRFEELLDPQRRHSDHAETLEQEAERYLRNVKKLVDKLDPKDLNGTQQRDFDIDLYKIAIPSLARIFVAACFWYEDRLNTVTLEVLMSMMDDIIKLRTRALRWDIKPDRKESVREPVIQKILAPLGGIKAAFRAQRSRLVDLRDREQQALENARYLAAQRKKHEEQKEERVRDGNKINRLNALYTARMILEPDRHRRMKLTVPPPIPRFGQDSNGVEYEREDIFEHRMPLKQWNQQQRTSLLNALNMYQGRNDLFVQIFNSLCGIDRVRRQWGPLRDFTVLDILRETRSLKQGIEHASQTDVFVDVPPCLKGTLPDLDLIEFILERKPRISYEHRRRE